jgi:hypothetical protein
MNADSLPDDVVTHAGLVLAHAAAIASVLEPGELICPFAVLTKGENRQSIEFEAETQDEAVALGWESLEKYKEHFDIWAFAREGLVRSANGKENVLVVASWTHGMSEPALFSQGFSPVAKGRFCLIGPLIVQAQPAAELPRLCELLHAGIAKHPKGHLWPAWSEI